MAILLFAYGTLTVPEVQEALFGRILESRPACLENWGRFMGSDGYLFVKPAPGCRVNGHLLSMTRAELNRADLWEDLTQYSRLQGKVVTDGGEQGPVFFYAKPSGRGRTCGEGCLCGLDLSGVFADIARLGRNRHNIR